MKTLMARRRGFTLLECLIYVSLWALLAVCTMQALGESRILRGRARDRAVMTMLAQGEIERLRSLPGAELKESSETKTDPSWPAGTTARIDLKPQGENLWLLDVRVERDYVEGQAPVRITTIRRGAVQ